MQRGGSDKKPGLQKKGAGRQSFLLPDPERLLVGSGKRMRHIKIRSLQESENPAITSLLAQAWSDGLKRVEQLHHKRA